MSIMEFVKKKKDEALATRVLATLTSPGTYKEKVYLKKGVKISKLFSL